MISHRHWSWATAGFMGLGAQALEVMTFIHARFGGVGELRYPQGGLIAEIRGKRPGNLCSPLKIVHRGKAEYG
jgi:hypothetical protein